MATGTVQRYDTSRGLGSIEPGDPSVDLFVDQCDAATDPLCPPAGQVRRA
jgi:cold shock CspA family protein